MTTRKSKRGKLAAWDWVKTAIVTAGTTILGTAITLLSSGETMNWQSMKPIVLTSAGAGLTYIFKQLSTNSDGKIAKEPEHDGYQ